MEKGHRFFYNLFFFYFKANLKSFSKADLNRFEFWIKITHHNKLYASACMHNYVS